MHQSNSAISLNGIHYRAPSMSAFHGTFSALKCLKMADCRKKPRCGPAIALDFTLVAVVVRH